MAWDLNPLNLPNWISELNSIFQEVIEEDLLFQEAKEVVKRNSKGKVWLAGGYLYRTLAQIMYAVPKPKETDLDFVVSKLKRISQIDVPGNWKANTKFRDAYNGTGLHLSKPSFLRARTVPNGLVIKDSIDCIELSKMGWRSNIDTYLLGVPLTIQSIAYDVDEKELLGEMGIRALEDRIVGINNFAELQDYAGRKNMPVEDCIKKKAESLKFGYSLTVPKGGELSLANSSPGGELSVYNDPSGRLSFYD